MIRLALAALVGILVIGACSGDDDGDPAAARQRRVAIGSPAEAGDWTITVTDGARVGTRDVMAENEFNDPPARGREFVLAKVRATREAGDKGLQNLRQVVQLLAIGDRRVAYDPERDWCGVVPDELDVQAEVAVGGTIEGHVCWSVVDSDVDSLVMVVTEALLDEELARFEL